MDAMLEIELQRAHFRGPNSSKSSDAEATIKDLVAKATRKRTKSLEQEEQTERSADEMLDIELGRAESRELSEGDVSWGGKTRKFGDGSGRM